MSSTALGQQVLVENRAGSNGNTGSEYVAKSAPDGYVLLVGVNGPIGISPSVYSRLGYDPTRDFVRYTDGTVNHWEKLERPGVLIENGHVTHVTLAVLDVPKEQEKGNDNHGSKIIVLPFDGAALDRDLQNAAATTPPAAAPKSGR